jgi:hypothetical protein
MFELNVSSPWYNPYGIVVNGKSYVVGNIIIFNSKGIVTQTDKGFFSTNNNELPHISFDVDCVKKTKINFETKTAFIIPNKMHDWQKNEVYLYIPKNVVPLSAPVYQKVWENRGISITRYIKNHPQAVFTEYVRIDRHLLEISDKINKIGEKLSIFPCGNNTPLYTWIDELTELAKQYKTEYSRIENINPEKYIKSLKGSIKND